MSAEVPVHDPLPYGRPVRPLFALRPDMAHLNHGSFGATPREILRAQAMERAAMEADPVEHMVGAGPRVRAIAEAVAARFGGRGADLALVENASAGVCAVLRGLTLRPGDRLVCTDHTYGAVQIALEHVARRAGAIVDRAPIPLPCPGPEAVIDALAPRLPGARLVVIDAITSPSALVLPVAELVARCRGLDVPVLVDAAHAPGHVPLALDALDADWVTGNLHKWAFAPKGAAFLWARADRHAETTPLVLSHLLGEGFPVSFDWVGTRDLSAWLVADQALALRDRWPDLLEDRRALARAGAEHVAARLGAEVVAPPEMTACMAALSLPDGLAAQPPEALRARARAAGVEACFTRMHDRTWLRVSAAVYNEADEYARLADELARWC